MKIGVFDSGIGGLTVLKCLIQKYPQSEFIYYGDTKNMPYGNKTNKDLKVLASKIIDFLINQGAYCIVIACGTVSSTIFNYLKSKYNIPIYNILTPTINYINSSNFKNIGVLATKNTIKTHFFKNNINKNCFEYESLMLAEKIEYNDNDIEEYIKSLINNFDNFDLLVLGCTHYPISINIFQKYLDIPILNMGTLIKIEDIKSNGFKLDIYYSQLTTDKIQITKQLINKDFNIYEHNLQYL